MIDIFFIISIFILLMLGIILVIFIPKNQQIYYSSEEQVQFLNYCSSNNDCSIGYLCDSITALCKKDLGQNCSQASDCAYPYICNGVCIEDVNTNVLNGNCPCNPSNLICVELENKSYQCKALGGQTCSQNSDCYSQVCSGGACLFGAPNAYSCNVNSDCESNNCNNGYCQDIGLISGNIGSYCVSEGMNGATCSSPLICQIDSEINGRCYYPTLSQYSQPCLPVFMDCYSEFTCNEFPYNVAYTGSGTEFSCGFNYLNPNKIVEGQTCIPQMTQENTNAGYYCVQNDTYGCNAENDCFNDCQLGIINLMQYTITGTSFSIDTIYTNTFTTINKFVYSVVNNNDVFFFLSQGKIYYLQNNVFSQFNNSTTVKDINVSSSTDRNYFSYLEGNEIFIYNITFEIDPSQYDFTYTFDNTYSTYSLSSPYQNYSPSNEYFSFIMGINNTAFDIYDINTKLSSGTGSNPSFYYDIENSFGMTASGCSCPYEVGKYACCNYENYLYINNLNNLLISGNESSYLFINPYTNTQYNVLNYSLLNNLQDGFLFSKMVLYCIGDAFSNFIIYVQNGNLVQIPFNSSSPNLMTFPSQKSGSFFILTNGTCTKN